MSDPKVYTIEQLKAARFKAVMFGDGANGMAVQVYRCVDFPRVVCTEMRKDRQSPWRRVYSVNGVEVASVEEVVAKLNEGETDG